MPMAKCQEGAPVDFDKAVAGVQTTLDEVRDSLAECERCARLTRELLDRIAESQREANLPRGARKP